MFVYNLSMAMVSVVTIAGAYFFLMTAGEDITPRCYLYHDYADKSIIPDSPESETWNEWMCNLSTVCFWTYPVVCPLVVVCMFLKNLLDSRLYYECLLNSILFDFTNNSYLYSFTFYLLIIYGSLALSTMIYIKSASSWANKDYHDLVYSLLAYLAPVGAFLVVLFSKWNIEWHLIPLARFCERDHKGAIRHLENSTFIKERDFRTAYEAAEGLLGRSPGRKIVLNTSEMLLLIRQQFEKKARPPSSWCCSCFKSYWVYRLLLSSHLDDSRSRSFRCWVRLYQVFIVVASMMFVWTVLHTTHYLLVFQHVLPAPLPLGPTPHDLKKTAT